MRICIHRGAQEIGGSCIEVAHDGARLILDIGLPLDPGSPDGCDLPPVDGLKAGDSSILGLILSHGHADHYGLASHVPASVPVYVGEATARILKEALFFTPLGAEITAVGYLKDRQPVQIGPFAVTPYLVDHSAFDAYALLVEAGGRRLFYSGDLRGHGRKAGLFERLVRDPPQDVDVLLLEGTNITAHPESHSLTERAVEDECVKLFRNTPGMVLTCYSPQNIDRLVTLYRAAKRSDRLFVMDLYAATVARATGLSTIPQADWLGVRVFVPHTQSRQIKQSREFDRVDWLPRHRIFREELSGLAGRLVMTFRESMAKDLARAGCLQEAHAVWSMWPGYLRTDSGVRLQKWLHSRAIPLNEIHSSGHATPSDLQRLAGAINAREVVPVHTRQPNRFQELFARVRQHPDGEWWTI